VYDNLEVTDEMLGRMIREITHNGYLVCVKLGGPDD
jgi:hypothetical protein